MKGRISYTREKRFKELFGLMARDDLFIRETPEKTFIITVPHPSEDLEYVVSSYRDATSPKEFVDLGRCTKAALELGAKAIRFDLLTDLSAN